VLATFMGAVGLENMFDRQASVILVYTMTTVYLYLSPLSLTHTFPYVENETGVEIRSHKDADVL
jgi:hypothetical protein